MSIIDEDDLFKDSTMSFGDHLEELRSCLVKSILGLVVGTLIGLGLGGKAVEVIQTPLKKALIDYYETRSKTEITSHSTDFYKRGYGKDVHKLPQKGLIVNTMMVNPVELAQILGIDPETLPKSKETPADQEKNVTAGEDTPWTFADYFSLSSWQTKAKMPWQKLENLDDNAKELAEAKDAGEHPDVPAVTRLVKVYTWHPVASDPRVQTKGFATQEPFMIYLKASLVVGILLASPWIFWQIWSFVAAGLYPHEKKYVHIFLPFSLGLFLGGAALAFFFVFEPVLRFLFFFNNWMGIEPDPRISEWLGFFLLLPLGFGISFQLPLVMLFIERIGVVTVEQFAAHWRVAILAIAFLSMLLTPGDPTSMIMMAVPLSILYMGGILLCRVMPRIKNPYAVEWEN